MPSEIEYPPVDPQRMPVNLYVVSHRWFTKISNQQRATLPVFLQNQLQIVARPDPLHWFKPNGYSRKINWNIGEGLSGIHEGRKAASIGYLRAGLPYVFSRKLKGKITESRTNNRYASAFRIFHRFCLTFHQVSLNIDGSNGAPSQISGDGSDNDQSPVRQSCWPERFFPIARLLFGSLILWFPFIFLDYHSRLYRRLGDRRSNWAGGESASLMA